MEEAVLVGLGGEEARDIEAEGISMTPVHDESASSAAAMVSKAFFIPVSSLAARMARANVTI